MSDWVSYQGKALGRIRLDDNGTNKFIYVAEGLDSLIALFRLNPTDIIEIEGRSNMTFEDFVKGYLKDISGFYPTLDAHLLRNYKAKTVEELDKPKA